MEHRVLGNEVDERWADAFTAADDFATLHRLVVVTARALVDADGATFVVRDGEACFYVAEDAIAPLWTGQRFPITECISGWCMLNDEPAVVADLHSDPRIPEQAYRPTFVDNLVMTPVADATGTEESSPVAAIGAYWGSARHRASAVEVDRLRRLAAVTATALARLGPENAPWAPQLRDGLPS
jgi:hypothetical protein